jgi:RHS repeat-associated protein
MITSTKDTANYGDTIIDGSGHNITISGGNNLRLFNVYDGTSLTLVNLVLANGKADNGGAIVNNGSLSMSYCTVIGNEAVGANGSNGANGSDSSSGNGSPGQNGSPGANTYGGGIYNLGTAAFNVCFFASNSVTGGTGGNGGNGGNTTASLHSGGDGGNGGLGGKALGGAVFSTNAVFITNCAFYVNTITGGNAGTRGSGGTGFPAGLAGDGGAGGEGSGAGLYADINSVVIASSFYGNTGKGGDSKASGTSSGGSGNSGKAGGASLGIGIYNAGTNVTINSTCYANSGTGGHGGNGGDATASLSKGGDGGNGGKAQGSGYYNDGNASITNCTFSTGGGTGGAGGTGGTGFPNGGNGSTGNTDGVNTFNAPGSPFILENSIIAYKNSGLSVGFGSITDAGHNICNENYTGLNNSTSKKSTDPLIAGILNNGGYTPTCALLSGSPAIDYGDPIGTPRKDQRGLYRNYYPDVGSYETNADTVGYLFVNIQATDAYAGEKGTNTGTFQITRVGNPNLAIRVGLDISGTASNGVDYATLPTNILMAAGVMQTNLTVTPLSNAGSESAESVVVGLKSGTNYLPGLYTNAVVTIGVDSNYVRTFYPTGERYVRGAGTNMSNYTIIVPLDGIRGTAHSPLDTNSPPTFYQYNGAIGGTQSTTNNRIPCNSTVASFGAAWGTTWYIGQSYSLGVQFANVAATPFYVYVFSKSYGTNVGIIPLSLPTATDWVDFATNGFARTTTAYGLTTTIRIAPDTLWGGSGGYAVTHVASADAINYTYVVVAQGFFNGQAAWLDSTNGASFAEIYDLTFDARPAWRSTFLDQPHFQGQPLPPDLFNKTPQELLNYGSVVTNAVSLTPTTCTNIDKSPELRRHSILDQFVSDLNKDPIALANYVQNEIELSDPIGFRDDAQLQNESVNLGGVNRSALAVYQEGRGSPMEQCALLIYLLRQAGYPACYVFPPDGGLKMLDTRLSALLRLRVNGSQDENGYLYTTNTLIPVNYPWVATYISNQWVHVFPWLKDSQVTEGLNLRDYLPDQYKELQLWVRDYVYGKTNIMGFASLDDDTPYTIFPAFLSSVLATNTPGISLDDIGMKYVNRRHLYTTWNDFPRPTLVTNTSIAVESLGSTSVTNVSFRLTNVFDTVYVEAFSYYNPTKLIHTSEMRMCDLHNRKFYLSHTNLGGGVCQAILTLGPYSPNATGTGTFATSDTTLTNKQIVTMNLDGDDDVLHVRIRYRRQKALTWQTAVDARAGFLGISNEREVLQERKLRKGDVAAICLNTGRVTPAMVRVHAQEIWNMEQQLSTNAAAASTVSPDVYQGSLVYLLGMSYYERVARFDDFNRRLNKIQDLSKCAMGLAKLSPYRNPDGSLADGPIDPVWPNVDMFFLEEAYVNNDTAHPDSGWDFELARRNYGNLSVANGSAQEHAVLNQFFGQSNSVSTVKVLQIAQSKVPSGGSNIVELNYFNYANLGTSNYNSIRLKDHDPDMWAEVANLFADPVDGPLTVAWVPPGAQTTPSGSYSGMAALVLSADEHVALVNNNQYGGYGDQLSPNTISRGSLTTWDLLQRADGSFQFNNNVLTTGENAGAPEVMAPFQLLTTVGALGNGAYAANPFQDIMARSEGQMLGTGGTLVNTVPAMYDIGSTPSPDARDSNGLLQPVYDPVNALTGEYYIDEVDLSLPGPMPLQVRRNYGSHNLANNQLGYGWKLNYMSYLTLGASNVVYESEPDGSTFAFASIATNQWAPTLALNPTLNNDSANGIGSVGNHLNAKLAKLAVGATNVWYLTNGDGSLRVFQEMSFPLTNSAAYDRLRPYLTYWYDNQSNFYRFEYGTNAAQADYGQVRRITSSSGNVVRFQYDVYSRMVDAYSIDGRRLQYDYDDHGDLVTVTLPDASQINFVYQHLSWATNGVTNIYSTHLVVREEKPDGRTLKNDYDDQRRVTNQWSTVGPDLRLVRNATFLYTNNFSLTNLTGTLSGTTTILDYTNNATTYYYTNGLIRRVRDPLGGELVQTWYEESETNAPAYPRSLKTVTDKRGLIATLKYDSQGNVTNTTVQGDLRGDGDTSATAVATAVFNGNNLPTQRVDMSGATNLYFYTNIWLLARLETWPSNATSSQAVTNLYTYTSVSNASDGTVSYGLRSQDIRAANSPDAATNQMVYSSRGSPTQIIRFTGDSDPTVTVTNLFNSRGELVQRTDAAGRSIRFGFDPRGNIQSREVFDTGQSIPISWDYFYYNENGDLTWSDGPRYNPEDYVWRDYDGAGRKTQEIHWRSEAKSDGSGVQAPANDSLYATTFSQWDAFGNLVKTVDPNGNYSLKYYDAVGQLKREEAYDTYGTLLATNGFSYNLAGDVTNTFNPLGGSMQKLFNARGQPKFQRNFDGSTNGWRYYADGRLRREIQRNGAYWETTYDDANRRTTKTFYSAAGSPLATNSTVLDRRGNLLQTVDAGFNLFTNLFDGLDRLKVAGGPPVVTIQLNMDFITYTTSVVQHVTTYIYTNSDKLLTVSNALGEKTVTTTDPLGRPLTVQTFAAGSSTPVRVTSTAYSADHQGATVTNGSGSSAIVSASYSDNDGRSLLSITYPFSNAREFTLRQYDLAGNLGFEERSSATNNSVMNWSGAAYEYDGLNRVVMKSDRDGALTYLYYDAAGDLTNQVLPGGGLNCQAAFNNAGQKLQEWVIGVGNAGTLTNTYTYYGAGSPFAGLLHTRTEGRGITSTLDYDDYLRVATNTHPYGGVYLPQITTWKYDVRGNLTNLLEHYNEFYFTEVRRKYDAYGNLVADQTWLNGVGEASDATQTWDSAGRRTSLGMFNFGYSYAWRADGLLASVSTAAGNSSYGYDSAGILTNRIAGGKVTTITSRDGAGRPLSVLTKVNTLTNLTETLARTGDGLLSSHTVARAGDFTNTQAYGYAALTRRLTDEVLNLNATNRWTNSFVYDGGGSAGLGLLTKVGPLGQWSGGADALSRIGAETNTVSTRRAYGRVNGSATISASLDAALTPVEILQTTDHDWSYQWRTTMELTPGAHRLSVSATHPGGMFVTNQSVWFTNNMGNQSVSDSYDAVGNLTKRVWKSVGGTTNHIQTLDWDFKGRLNHVQDIDEQGNVVDWNAVYDGLDRRIYSYWQSFGTNTSGGSTIVQFYDPQVEFLELGVINNGLATWRVYGPDMSGSYGGMQGIAGLDAIVEEPNIFEPVLSDARGNLQGYYSPVEVKPIWISSRPTGYGGVPGYRPVALDADVNLAQASAWLGAWSDVTGFYWRGKRYYDPVPGRWVSADSVWNGQDPNYFTFCGGDPINSFDPDGRFGKGSVGNLATLGQSIGSFAQNAYYSASYGVAAAVYGTDQAGQWYGQNWQGLKNTFTGTAQTSYDVAALVSYTAMSQFNEDFALDAYGGSINRLGQVGNALSGGEGNSISYRAGYTTTGILTMMLGNDMINAARGGPIAGAESAVTLFENQFPDHPIASPLQTFSYDQVSGSFSRRLNYVVTEDAGLILGRQAYEVGGGHIDLAGGAPVQAAGEAKFVHGQLQYIDNASGHYLPSGSAAQDAAVNAFENAGLGGTGLYIEKVWNGRAWVPK